LPIISRRLSKGIFNNEKVTDQRFHKVTGIESSKLDDLLIRDSTIAQMKPLRHRKSVAIRIKSNGNEGVNGHLSPKNAKIQARTQHGLVGSIVREALRITQSRLDLQLTTPSSLCPNDYIFGIMIFV
jgi:hypothetical protein